MLDRLTEVGLVDDEAFAAGWVAVPARRPRAGPRVRSPSELASARSRGGGGRRRGRGLTADQTRPRPPAELVRRSLRAIARADRADPGPPAGRVCSPARATRPALAYRVVREELDAEREERAADALASFEPEDDSTG